MLLRLTAIVFLCLMLAGCSPEVLKVTELSPVRSSTTVTLRDVFRVTGRRAGGLPPNLEKVVIFGVDSTYYALSLFEIEDLVVLHLVVVNQSSKARVIQPDEITLQDRSRSVFKRLEPHEAANLQISHLANGTPYQVKQSPYVENRTTVQEIQPGYYTSKSYDFRNPIGEVAYQAAYDFENAMAKALGQNKNKKYTQIAGMVYALGFIEGSIVPAKANYEGALYWLNQEPRPKPLWLRFFDRGEIQFELNGK